MIWIPSLKGPGTSGQGLFFRQGSGKRFPASKSSPRQGATASQQVFLKLKNPKVWAWGWLPPSPLHAACWLGIWMPCKNPQTKATARGRARVRARVRASRGLPHSGLPGRAGTSRPPRQGAPRQGLPGRGRASQAGAGACRQEVAMFYPKVWGISF